MIYKTLVFPLILLILSIPISSCEDPIEAVNRHISKGTELYDSNEFDKARIEFKNALQIDPNSAEAYLYLGKIEDQNKNLNKAVGYYYKATELSPGMIEAHTRLGRIFLQQAALSKSRNNTKTETGYLSKSQEHSNISLKIDADNINAQVLEASLLAYNGKNNDAIKLLQQSIKSHPDNTSARILLARIYIQTSRHHEAESVLLKGINASPYSKDLYLELVSYYAVRSQYTDAIRMLKKVILLDPDTMYHKALLADFYLKANKPENAEKVYIDSIKAKPDDLSRYFAYSNFIKEHRGINSAIEYLESNITNPVNVDNAISIRLASFYLEANDTEKAKSLLNKIISKPTLTPASISARKKLVAIYLSEKNISHAKRLVEEILSEYPKDHDAMLYKGVISIHENDYIEAISALRLALKNEPDSIEIQLLLAESYRLNGETDLALQELITITKKHPNDINSRLKFSHALLEAHKYESALVEVNKVLDLSPDNINAIILKSDILLQQKRIQEVISLLNDLKKVAPSNAEGWFRMGRIYKHMNELEKARLEFIHALEKAPDSNDLLAELTDIEIELGMTNSARIRLKKKLEAQPHHPSAHNFLGMVYISENKSSLAEKEFLTQLETFPNDLAALIQLGKLNYEKNNLDQAKLYFSQGKLIAPSNPEIISGLEQIRATRLDNK